MSNRRLSSPYFRYLKARLWNITRPGFWGTAIFLSVVGLTIREFWMRPDILTSRRSKPVATQPQANSTLSAEDRAIAADIDNLPILAYDSEQGRQPIDTSEPISQPKKGNQNPLQEAIKNQKNSRNARSNTNSIPAPTFRYNNPFLTQAENLLQFGNPLRNGSSSFVGLNTFNQSGQSNRSGLRVANGKSNNSTQRLVDPNSLEAALNPSSINQPQNQTLLNLQTAFNQTSNPNQSITQLPNNINTLPQGFAQPFASSVSVTTQGINNSVLPTQFAQPITIQPQTVYNNNIGANPIQPQTVYNNNIGANPIQPQTVYNNLNGVNPIQPQNVYNNNIGANPIQPQTVYNNLNGVNPIQPQTVYNNNIGATSTQPRTYTNNNNLDSNVFNNIQRFSNSNFVPQTTSTVNRTVTPSTSNNIPSTTTLTPSNAVGNGTLINPAQQPNNAPSQYPNSGLPVRY